MNVKEKKSKNSLFEFKMKYIYIYIDFTNFDLSILIISTNVRWRLIRLKINNYDHNVYHIPYILTHS